MPALWFVCRRPHPGAPACDPEAGFSLMEVIVATIIATIAVVGLAYTFGMGRGFIDRFEIGRAALAEGEGLLDQIGTAASTDTLVDPSRVHQRQFVTGGIVAGMTYWQIGWRDDPADGSALSSPADVDTSDLRAATVTVAFREGTIQDTVRFSRLLAKR